MLTVSIKANLSLETGKQSDASNGRISNLKTVELFRSKKHQNH